MAPLQGSDVMNLLEAIKSGRPFRRKNWDLWTQVHGNCVTQPGLTEGLRQAHMCYEDILADDWEIQEPTVTITRAQFLEAVESVLGSFNLFGDAIADCAMRTLAHSLGLGNP